MSNMYFNDTDKKAVVASDTIRVKRYAVQVNGFFPDCYIKLDTFINADSKFLTMYKIPPFGPISPVTKYAGRNSLTTWKSCLVDGVPGTSLLSDQIIFDAAASVSVGDFIDVYYVESPMVMPMATLGIKGWDFNTDTEIATDGDLPEPTTFNHNICTTGYCSSTTGLTILDISSIDNGIDLPQENRVTYSNTVIVHYYIPNCLRVQEWTFGVAFPPNFVLEVFKLPKQVRHSALNLNRAGGHLNFQGHYTINKMNLHELQQSISSKILARNGLYAFRFRNLLTNEVSDWLPLKMYMKMRSKLKDGNRYSRIVFLK